MNLPLSDFLRPKTFEEIAGQEKTVAWLQAVIKSQKPLSLLFFGPPGCGKTTIAKLYVKSFSKHFVFLSAVFSSISDIKQIVLEAEKNPIFKKPTVVFVDEIHRFNKAQQDSFLPFIENGTIILVGSTTENPSFALNNALLSRLRILDLKPLDIKDLNKVIENYEKRFSKLNITQEAKEFLIQASQGDARFLLNMIENLQNFQGKLLNEKDLLNYIQKRSANYDKNADTHYNLISAFHKSIRGSDVDAALYWLCRMLEGKEDPLFITRRLIRISLEDIGLTDQNALHIALMADKVYKRLGAPEGELAIAQATIYLALCAKSNRIYVAYEKAKKIAQKTTHLSPPLHILNAPNKFLKDLEYSKGYMYDHDLENSISNQTYFPKELEKQNFFEPKNIGFEKELQKRMKYFEKLRQIYK